MKDKILNWQTGAGTITLCPLRGRILQVEIAGKDAFWANPSYSGDWNIGGDRLWVGPEVDWHWKSLEKVDFAEYELPEAVDPGNWEISKDDKGYCQVRQDVLLNNHHKDSNIQFELIRSFTALELSQRKFFRKQIAFQTDNELHINRGTKGQKVDIWSLLQVPNSGKMYIRCGGGKPFRDYFSPIANNLWRKDGDFLQIDITGKDHYKVGIAPALINGAVAYARKVADEYLVVYRKFFPQPWRLYSDVPMNDLNGAGDALQVYNDDGPLGGFGELEYHSPTIQVGQGNNHIMDSNLTIVGLVCENQWQDWLNHWL